MDVYVPGYTLGYPSIRTILGGLCTRLGVASFAKAFSCFSNSAGFFRTRCNFLLIFSLWPPPPHHRDKTKKFNCETFKSLARNSLARDAIFNSDRLCCALRRPFTHNPTAHFYSVALARAFVRVYLCRQVYFLFFFFY